MRFGVGGGDIKKITARIGVVSNGYEGIRNMLAFVIVCELRIDRQEKNHPAEGGEQTEVR